MPKRPEKKLYDVVLPEGTPPDLRRVIEYVNALERRLDGVQGPLPPPLVPPGVTDSWERAKYAALLAQYRVRVEMGDGGDESEGAEDVAA
jgi:hypothetical protein